jgi:hypothetical protein
VRPLTRLILVHASLRCIGLNPLFPIRPYICAGHPALRAHHPRLEGFHGKVAGQMVDVHDHLVPTLPTAHIERANAVVTHVVERHRFDGSGERAIDVIVRKPRRKPGLRADHAGGKG